MASTHNVWVRLEVGDEEPVEDIVLVDKNIVECLRHAVKAQMAVGLTHCVAAELKIFLVDGNLLALDVPLPTGNSMENPLIIKAPPKQASHTALRHECKIGEGLSKVQLLSCMWKYCVLIEFYKTGSSADSFSVSSYCTGVIFDTDAQNIFLLLNWHTVKELRGNHTMRISQPQTGGGDFIVLKEHDIVHQGDYISMNEADDWVWFRIELLNHGLSPPPLFTGVQQTLKVHIFGYPNVGDVSLDISEIDQYPPSGRRIPAQALIKWPGHYLVCANSRPGFSGATMFCDQSGGILGITCGPWKDHQAHAVSIHRLPYQNRYSPLPYIISRRNNNSKKQKVDAGN